MHMLHSVKYMFTADFFSLLEMYKHISFTLKNIFSSPLILGDSLPLFSTFYTEIIIQEHLVAFMP